MRRFVSLLLCLLLIAPALNGCASKYGEQKTTVNYYPACYAPIQDLRERENDVGKTTAGGAIVGALGGALIGLLATGKVEGAAVGAAAGGATGAVAGNIYAKKQRQADDNMRLNSYLQALDGDINNLNVESAAARTSIQCYNQQFRVLVNAIKAKQIDRQAAAMRFSEISTGYEEAQNILGNAASTGENLARQYEQAFIDEERDMQISQSPARPRNISQNQKTLNTARKRNRDLAQKAQSLRQEKEEAAQQQVSHAKEINLLFSQLEDSRL